ncbi:MAG: OmpA family protein [Deltaproteobacteria bacterium]|nr:OmpA family protein [Deltaproteobacteria bacterium]
MKTTTILGTALAMSLMACSAKTPPPAQPPAPEPVAEAEPEAEAAPEDPSDVHIEGDHLTIDQKIHFAVNSDEILEDSNEILDHIATALGNHSEFGTVHVVGHTDASGGADHNQDLSERRAAAVVAALGERGVTQTIDARGAGEAEPVCSEDTDECHERNRRVEFIVQ